MSLMLSGISEILCIATTYFYGVKNKKFAVDTAAGSRGAEGAAAPPPSGSASPHPRLVRLIFSVVSHLTSPFPCHPRNLFLNYRKQLKRSRWFPTIVCMVSYCNFSVLIRSSRRVWSVFSLSGVNKIQMFKCSFHLITAHQKCGIGAPW